MMNLKWDLSELFASNELFYKEIKKIKLKLLKMKKYDDMELDEDSLLKLLDDEWSIKELSNNVLVYGSLRYYQNIHSEECIKLKEDAEKLHHQVQLELSFVDRKILDLGKGKIEKWTIHNPKLDIYQLHIDNLFRKQEHVPSDMINGEIHHHLQSIDLQLKAYNDLLRDINYGSVELDAEQVQITPSNLAKYLASRDRDTRRKVYLEVYEQFQKEEEKFASILDSIYDFRIQNAHLENYPSVLEKVLMEENIDSRIIDSLIRVVHRHFDLIQHYLKMKADLLGIDKPHVYDFGVPLDSQLKIKYSFEEAIEIIKNALKPLGKDYLEVVFRLLNGHVDAEANEKKHQSIVFSWNTYSFMNFRGAYTDLKNMIHELGHIVNYYLSNKNLPFIYEDSTVFVGETASIVNEILLNRYLYEHATTKEEKIFYLSKEIENYFTSVFKQTMYTEFENDLYRLKETKVLTPKLLSQRYGKLIRKYYGKDLVYDQQSNIEWTRLGHLFRWSYYPYKYATGLIIASVVVQSLNDKTLSKEEYLQFLSSGSSKYSLDLLKMIHIDFSDLNMIENGFKVLEEDIQKLEEALVEDSNHD